MKLKFAFLFGLSALAMAAPAARPAVPENLTVSSAAVAKTARSVDTTANIVLDLPPRLLNNASAILDLLGERVHYLSHIINHTMTHSPITLTTDQAEAIADHLTPTLNRLYRVLVKATRAVRRIGLKVKGPEHTDVVADDMYCDAMCIVNKAGVIVSEITGTASNVIDTLGLSNVSPLVHPVLAAAEDLLKSLDGSVPDMAAKKAPTPNEGRHIRKSIKRRIQSLLRRVLGKILSKVLRAIFSSHNGKGSKHRGHKHEASRPKTTQVKTTQAETTQVKTAQVKTNGPRPTGPR